MKELAALAYRDTTAENREFWKNEMGQALREIQQVYEDKLDTMRSEIEASYSLKVTLQLSPFHTVVLYSSAQVSHSLYLRHLLAAEMFLPPFVCVSVCFCTP